MAYIGNLPSKSKTITSSQYFNGDGSTVAFTMNKSVNASEDIEVFVDNVQQEPGSGKSYTATGNTLTFDAAPSSGTDNVYVIYRGEAERTIEFVDSTKTTIGKAIAVAIVFGG